MIFGTHDDKTLEQLADVAKEAAYVSLMADGHLGYFMPIGGVAAYKDKVSVTGIGYDIGCGNCAVRTDIRADDLDHQGLHMLGETIQADYSFGVGGKNQAANAPKDHPLFESDAWDIIPSNLRNSSRDKARSQLGSIGSGNHYVDIFRDELGWIWIGVHFGSRGFGHFIARNFISIANGNGWGGKAVENAALLDTTQQSGMDYITLMELAGTYAYAGRNWVADDIAENLLGCSIIERVHNNHNFAWWEEHYGEYYHVVRKGATPAFPGQQGFVGGSMGDDAVILHGKENGNFQTQCAQQAALYSTVHGAGRVMGRMQAKGKYHKKTGECIRPGRIKQEEMDAWIASRGVLVFGGDLDEAPQAYRRLPDVLADQGDTIVVDHTLTPLVVVMAGKERRRR
jgi:tRNA-splicing ligase RtcB